MIDGHKITPEEPPTTPQSRSVPTGQLAESVHFYATHHSGSHEALSDRDSMLNEAAHILASSHYEGYDARYLNNPRLEQLMNQGRFETSEIKYRAVSLGLLKPVIHNYPEQVPDTAATTEPMFRQLRAWLRGMGHGRH